MVVGEHTYGTENINVIWQQAGREVYIGKYCSFALNCLIYLGGNHNTDWITTYPFTRLQHIIPAASHIQGVEKTNGNVIIGNDVWVANNVTIQSGVNISDGCVIAANSVVVKNCEPYGIYGGNPAKLIKYRFNQDQIESLLKIKWWDWDFQKIKENVLLISSKNIDEFTENFG